MKNISLTVITIAAELLVAGCSKTSPNPPIRSKGLPPNTKNLGVVELRNHEQRQYDLGNGKKCTVTFVAMPDKNVEVDFLIQGKDAKGNLHTISAPRVEVNPGRAVAVSDGNVSITLIPKLKSN